jgi:Fumarylacetoacetase N-terminal
MKSWIQSANEPSGQFPIQDLPYGVFCSSAPISHCCVAIGDEILDLTLLEETRLIETGCGQPVFNKGSLNPFMALGPAHWCQLRTRLTDLLIDDGDALERAASSRMAIGSHSMVTSMAMAIVSDSAGAWAGSSLHRLSSDGEEILLMTTRSAGGSADATCIQRVTPAWCCH